ncbi:DUF4936 family protein [Derxia lacustris]|uniref:DUF4936 family protein n=1 Tax=Derxia lacustris TaxID=764842 RepID=UPI000A16F9CB|nr:DUF4936 family protein [Derxia lacustris]
MARAHLYIYFKVRAGQEAAAQRLAAARFDAVRALLAAPPVLLHRADPARAVTWMESYDCAAPPESVAGILAGLSDDPGCRDGDRHVEIFIPFEPPTP